MNKAQMNTKYAKVDPFGVKTDNADATRKAKILSVIQDIISNQLNGVRFKRALDIGCGEGFITTDLPADEITGFDISDIALSRCPENMVVVDDPANIKGKFDLVICTGSLVREYDFAQILGLIHKHASGIVLTCQTHSTEVKEVATLKNQTHIEQFPYRDLKQTLRIFDYYGVDKVDETDENPMPDLSTAEMNLPVDVNVKVTVDVNKAPEADKTFKEIVDEAIDALPTDHGFDHLILSTDQHFQLMNQDAAAHYRGFKLEINDEESFGSYEFYKRPETADAVEPDRLEGHSVDHVVIDEHADTPEIVEEDADGNVIDGGSPDETKAVEDVTPEISEESTGNF